MRGRMEVGFFELPAYWASALINGDYSGLDASERQQLEAEVAKLATDGWEVVDVNRSADGEPLETYIGRYNGFLSDMLEYVALRPVEGSHE